LDKEQLKKIWKDFAERNKEFMLNPNNKFLDALAQGILTNEKTYGYKFCPCRLRNGTKDTDLTLLCPCNFHTQQVWREQGRCWCGLFVKK
jgi:ferredoxin-thioredoxin reductase catalytic subunit